MIDARRVEFIRSLTTGESPDTRNPVVLAAAIHLLLADREELLGLLREVEWEAPYEPCLNESPGEACPVCGESKRDGHEKGCRLAAALGKTGG